MDVRSVLLDPHDLLIRTDGDGDDSPGARHPPIPAPLPATGGDGRSRRHDAVDRQRRLSERPEPISPSRSDSIFLLHLCPGGRLGIVTSAVPRRGPRRPWQRRGRTAGRGARHRHERVYRRCQPGCGGASGSRWRRTRGTAVDGSTGEPDRGPRPGGAGAGGERGDAGRPPGQKSRVSNYDWPPWSTIAAGRVGGSRCSMA